MRDGWQNRCRMNTWYHTLRHTYFTPNAFNSSRTWSPISLYSYVHTAIHQQARNKRHYKLTSAPPSSFTNRHTASWSFANSAVDLSSFGPRNVKSRGEP